MSDLSTKPYLVRALFEWCTDAGYTPYLSVAVDDRTRVPREFVRDGQIVLNISHMATQGLVIDNDSVRFQARFGGVARDLMVPMGNVQSIYARETGQGMAFEVDPAVMGREDVVTGAEASHGSPAESGPSERDGRPSLSAVPTGDVASLPSEPPEPPPPGPRTHLKRVK